MDHLGQAIRDQKFIYEPYEKLLDRVPEIESLWDELTQEYYKINWGISEPVENEVTMPANFGKYLRDNVERFYRSDSISFQNKSKEERIQIHEAHICFLQKEIERLRESQETLQDENRRQGENSMRAFMEILGSLKLTMTDQCDRNGWELAFGIWTYNLAIGADLG